MGREFLDGERPSERGDLAPPASPSGRSWHSSTATPQPASQLRRALGFVRDHWAYLLALMPILTDWLETGTLPPHLHDYLTEIVIGGMMAAAVWLLYRERAELRALAQTDSLTGLRNQRRFREDLESEVERAARLGTELVLAYLDVDDFKSVNDRHGHVAGDEVLKRVGHALGALRGRVDRCYRVGGDEFAVLMPGASAADALRAISRATSLAQPTPGAQAPVVTLSVGAVELAPGEEPAALLARADRFMYGAKRDSADLFQEGASAGHVTLEG